MTEEYRPEDPFDVCGETYDHDTYVTFEDEYGLQWMCRRCGAEGWEEDES